MIESKLAVAFVVVSSTLMWPVNRWAVRAGARPAALGLMISVVGLPIILLLARLMHSPLGVGVALGLGSVGAIAYAVGFVMIIFYCLKIGPAGLTTTVNNMGLVWPVLTGMLWFSKSGVSAEEWIGLALTLISLTLVGVLRRNPGAKDAIAAKWVAWVFVGWVLSGISMSSQFLSSQYAPTSLFAYMAALYAVSGVLFVIILIASRNVRLTREELLAGAGTGVLHSLSQAATLWALIRLSASVVFPIAVAGPVLLMLLIGHFALKERLSAMGWAAGFIGVSGLVLLSVR